MTDLEHIFKKNNNKKFLLLGSPHKKTLLKCCSIKKLNTFFKKLILVLGNKLDLFAY